MGITALAFTACGDPKDNGDNGDDSNKPGTNYMRRDNDFEDDGIYRRYDFSDYDIVPPVVDIYEQDTGVLEDHIFEAESLMQSGSSNNGTDFDHACAAKSFQFDPAFSGNICLKNTKYMKLTLTVTSDKSVNVPVTFSVSNTYGTESLVGEPLENYFTVNNISAGQRHVADLSEVLIPEGGQQITSNYFTMVDVTFRLDISKGVNEIEITTMGNLDYINIQTSATLGENTTTSTWLDDIDIEAKANESTLGQITFKCKNGFVNNGSATFNTLPAITDPIYTQKTVTDGDVEYTEYYLTLLGKEIKVYDNKPPEFLPEDMPTGESLGDTIAKSSTDSSSFWDVASDGNPNKSHSKGWYNYSSVADYEGTTGVPEVKTDTDDNRYLSFTKAGRYELFWVQDDNGKYYHLGDNASWTGTNAPTALFGQEFVYTLNTASNGKFMFEILGNSISEPNLNDMANGYKVVFDGSKLDLYGHYNGYGSLGLLASATLDGVNLTDGSKHDISFGITRIAHGELKIRMFVDGEKVYYIPATSSTAVTFDNGTLYCSGSGAYNNGQRFSVVPLENANNEMSTVDIYGLERIKVTQ